MTTTRKRSLLSLLTGILCAVGLLAQAETRQGYLSFSVKVTEENAPLYSSPGEENAYVTGYLKSGDLLEVFLRTSDGWCAVRPPEGSFSWINADYVSQTGSDTGTVVSPDPAKEVPVRVGAASILKSSDVQVGLENGSQVRILGEQTLTGNKRWLKIAPPRGEFRWIRVASLEQDEFLANIPDRLTRYEEMLSQNGYASYSSLPGDFSPETMNRLDEERLSPEAEITGEAIRNVSFESSFNRELARLYRDLLTAVESPEPSPIYDDLARRASALESFASDDVQRSEARKLVTQIEEKRGSASDLHGGILTSQSSAFVNARPIYQSPVSGKPSDSEQVLFTVPQRAAVPQMNRTAANTPNPAVQQPNKVRFAFAPRAQQTADSQVSEKRGLFTPKPSAIVPPANYTYPAPTLLKVSPQPASSGDSAPVQAPGSPQQNSPQNQPSEQNKVFLAQNEPNQEIRQVSALFVKPNIEPPVPQPVTPDPKSGTAIPGIPLPANTPQTAANAPSPEVSGVLGFLPNSRGGVPSYALISKTGNQNSILCYVVPQEGKSLDPYVGKKVAVAGTRSWFKKGEENRKMIVAESIRIY